MFMSRVVGITGSLPVEVPFAAGWTVLDLNNIFINSEEPLGRVEAAERDGFPKSYCSWIKGIYSTVLAERIETVLVVAGGDCTNTRLLSEVLQLHNVSVHHFTYPYPADRKALEGEVRRLCSEFGTTMEEAEEMKRELDKTRKLLQRLDELTYNEHKVNGKENHLYLVSASDFRGAPEEFYEEVLRFVEEAEGRKGSEPAVRLAFVGIPPIQSELYDFILSLDADVVLNETQRQFACIPPSPDLITQYLRFTYPYEFERRFDDIAAECRRRNIDGIIHYTQSFCFRSGYTMLLKEHLRRAGLDIPVLQFEADTPSPLTAQQKTRLEAFVEMLRIRRT